MSRAQFTVAISTDEEAAASKRMVIYAFSAQINLFTSLFYCLSKFYSGLFSSVEYFTSHECQMALSLRQTILLVCGGPVRGERVNPFNFPV